MKELTNEAKHGGKYHVQKIVGVVTEWTNAADFLCGYIGGRACHVWRKPRRVEVTATVELHQVLGSHFSRVENLDLLTLRCSRLMSAPDCRRHKSPTLDRVFNVKNQTSRPNASVVIPQIRTSHP